MVTEDLNLSALETSVVKLQKSGKVPFWKLSFAEYLLKRIKEYTLVGLNPEALETKKRLEQWLSEHLQKIEKQKKVLKPIEAFDIEFIKNKIIEIKQTLSKKSPLIPAPEREFILRHLLKIEKSLEEKSISVLYEEILHIRLDLISRLQRSYRARAALLPLNKSFNEKILKEKLEASKIGPYNIQKTLDSAFSLIGERDPIWVEDFLELYSELFRYVKTLTNEKKK